MFQQKESILKQLEKLNKKISNPKELIKFTFDLSSNLTKIWDLGDYYQKQIFQNIIFPDGLVYDSKNDHYRTPKVNSVIGYISEIARDLENKKSRSFKNFSKKTGPVPYGLDLSNFLDDLNKIKNLKGHIKNMTL